MATLLLRECGPTLLELTQALSEVRIILADQGVESGIVNARNIAPVLFGLPAVHEEFLFPNALYVMGWNHSANNALGAALKAMDF